MSFRRYTFTASVATADGVKATMNGAVIAPDFGQAMTAANRAVSKLLKPADVIQKLSVHEVKTRRAKR